MEKLEELRGSLLLGESDSLLKEREDARRRCVWLFSGAGGGVPAARRLITQPI